MCEPPQAAFHPRNATIDVLRGIAAISVAVFHFNEPYPALGDFYHRAAKWGWLGVPAFFVVSGYCVAAARSKTGLVAFWGRRLLRILPPYWASVALVLAVVGFRLLTTGTNDAIAIPKTVSAWLLTAAALTAPASSVPGVNWVYWSLGYELAFYILLGLLFVRYAGPCVMIVSALALLCPGFPFDYWGLFGLGVSAWFATRRQHGTAIGIAVFCIAGMAMRQTIPQDAVGLAAAGLIVFPPAFMARPSVAPLRWAGSVSYSLYLIHVPVSCLLIARYLPFSRALAPSLLQDALLLAASLAAAWLFHRIVEKPSHRFARRLQA